jgi:hypothetical protein
VSIDSRLSRLSPALSALERAILILNAWKEGKEEDPSWRRYMPADQTQAFNRYIGLMNVANRQFGIYIGLLARSAAELRLREAWLVSLTLWQEHIDEMRRALRLSQRSGTGLAAFLIGAPSTGVGI